MFPSEQAGQPICGVMGVMTSAQLLAARMLIPGEYELNAPPHRARRPEPPAPAAPFRETGHPQMADASYIVAAPARPTTRLRFAGAILGDIALCVALIYGALLPGLAIHGIQAAVALILKTVGGH